MKTKPTAIRKSAANKRETTLEIITHLVLQYQPGWFSAVAVLDQKSPFPVIHDDKGNVDD